MISIVILIVFLCISTSSSNSGLNHNLSLSNDRNNTEQYIRSIIESKVINYRIQTSEKAAAPPLLLHEFYFDSNLPGYTLFANYDISSYTIQYYSYTDLDSCQVYWNTYVLNNNYYLNAD